MLHQHDCATLIKQVRAADHIVTVSLTACDIGTQTEMLAELLECIQELRVRLQRIESVFQESLP